MGNKSRIEKKLNFFVTPIVSVERKKMKGFLKMRNEDELNVPT